MKKKLLLLLSIFIIIGIIIYIIGSHLYFHTRVEFTYDAEKAVAYSYQYVHERNKAEFAVSQYNCTNYISQCLLAGNIEMDGTAPTSISRTKIVPSSNKWFCYSYDIDPYKPIAYYMSSSFSRINDFIVYWSKIVKVPYYTIENTKENIKNLTEKVKVGDVLILHSLPSHCAIIVKIDEDEIYYNSNSNDRMEYPLSSVDENTYKQISYFNFVK